MNNTESSLATIIEKISDSLTKIYKTGLNQEAIVALIIDTSPKVGTRKLGKREVRAVLKSIRVLKNNYCGNIQQESLHKDNLRNKIATWLYNIISTESKAEIIND